MHPLPRYSSPILGAILLVFFGAIAYSSKAIFVKLAYRYGVDSVSLVALRMAFSLPFFLAVASYSRWQKQAADTFRPKRRHWLELIVLGLLGYYVASLCDFMSLQYLSASLGRLILFIYPTLVLLLTAVFLKRKVSRVEAAAVIISYIGIILAFSQSVEIRQVPDFWMGVLFSFTSALTFALYLIGSGEYLPRMGTLRYNSLTMSIACAAILLHHGIQYRWALFHFPMPVYGYALGMALVATVLPSFMVAEGIRRLGAGTAAIISSVGPISTILLASLILGETFGGWQWLGAVLVIGGVLLLSWWKQRRSMP
ncbi:MAG TPA: DMT family transporter [Saprospiraceae bacterium]|nr:DMT family transporter [Saprospiraceae bacterium]HMQ83121.1 DMT family transporter [Saprospiraceae bacterium]